MITKLTMKNFQSHKDTVLEFTDGVSIISGSGDTGKTSVLRSISWLTTGKPNGFGFHSNWCKHGDKTEVRLDMDNGYVHRSKSKSKNTWDCDGLELNATGQGVPDEVASLVNWDEVNYSPQHGGAFLLTDSEGAVAKKLNGLVGLDIIDRTIGNISKEVKTVNSSIKVKKEAVADIDAQLDGYMDLDEAVKEMKKLDVMEQKYFEMDDRYRDLKELITIVDELESEMVEFNGVDEAIESIVVLLDLDEEIKMKRKYSIDMSTSLDVVLSTHEELKAYSELDRALLEIDELISIYSDIEVKKVVVRGLNDSIDGIVTLENELEVLYDVSGALIVLNGLIEMYSSMEEKEEYIRMFKRQFDRVKDCAMLVRDIDVEIDKMKITFKDAMGDICPLCEQGI